MGMFDNIRFKYPLPAGTPDLGWQTKDTPAQLMDLYEVREDGSLWHQTYDIEDQSDPNAEGIMRLVGSMARVNEAWEPCNMTGEIRFYSYEGKNTKLWWEFSAYFVNGKIQHLETIKRPDEATP